MSLKDKVAIVTGGKSGIGKAIAEKFVQEGAVVVILDQQVEDGEERLRKVSDHMYEIKVNVTDKEQMLQAVSVLKHEFGHIHIFVNNAGIFRDARMLYMTEDEWDSVLNVNLKGTFLGIQAIGPVMLEQQYGKIINISSVSYRGNFGQANYSASKAGIVSLTKTAALELAPYISVNCIAPGAVQTPLFASMNEKGKEKFLRKIPMGRAGRPEEIANAAHFFASDASSYVTGTVLDVDGGLTAGLNLR